MSLVLADFCEFSASPNLRPTSSGRYAASRPRAHHSHPPPHLCSWCSRCVGHLLEHSAGGGYRPQRLQSLDRSVGAPFVGFFLPLPGVVPAGHAVPPTKRDAGARTGSMGSALNSGTPLGSHRLAPQHRIGNHLLKRPLIWMNIPLLGFIPSSLKALYAGLVRRSQRIPRSPPLRRLLMNFVSCIQVPRMPTGRSSTNCAPLVLELPQMLTLNRSAVPWLPLRPLQVRARVVCALLICKMHFVIPLVI